MFCSFPERFPRNWNKNKENKTTEIEINDPQNHGDGVLSKLTEERDAKFLAAKG